ncbi:MAG: tRNA preQ1(34) S-adenosylmethionine ribosyltransferase-isomerase QueA [Actinobacteria bacterium]|nr:tRNA preQ1(34) S-adenosylmethionine ribosyltransferase-isomerase QueA [Actinomycetota bacterium]
MSIRLFDYSLPEHLIAKCPIRHRDQSRLMVLDPRAGTYVDRQFSQLSEFIQPNDVLVLNNTKVFKARLIATRETGAHIELLLMPPRSNTEFQALVKPAKRVKVGETLQISPDFHVTILHKDGPMATLQFNVTDVMEKLDRHGSVPLPGYMKVPMDDANSFSEQYQTVFAKHAGSIAAPTAGLHFTPATIQALKDQGVIIETVTLHVGYGTFQPIQSDTLSGHAMHEETYYIDPETAARLNEYRGKRRVIAVGTTVVRALESAVRDSVTQSGHQSTRLFITPGFSFQSVDALVTNFHLPKSSLFVLVAAFAGLPFIQAAYQHAIQESYRFYSFGDAMLIQNRS